LSETWFCKDCPLTGTDLGEWDSSSDFFRNVVIVHKNHRGFQQGVIQKKVSELEQHTTALLESIFHSLIQNCKGCTKVMQIKDRYWWEMDIWTY
jgi:hypothetical protein